MVVGIDVSLADFHACLLQAGAYHRNTFANNPKGFARFLNWLKNRRVVTAHVCMEATGAYWFDLAKYLYDAGLTVSVVNPAKTSFYARSQLRRTKTDSVDAQMLADFCATQSPSSWEPPSPELIELRGLLAYRKHVVENRTRLKQLERTLRLGADVLALQQAEDQHTAALLKAIDKQLKGSVAAHETLHRLMIALQAVKGIGFITAATLLARLPADRLRNAKAAAAYAGLTPREFQSGTSVYKAPRLCKIGDGELRSALYMAALTARRYNPILKAFAENLCARGKAPKVILAAIMRKLVVLAYRIMTGQLRASIGTQPLTPQHGI